MIYCAIQFEQFDAPQILYVIDLLHDGKSQYDFEVSL